MRMGRLHRALFFGGWALTGCGDVFAQPITEVDTTDATMLPDVIVQPDVRAPKVEGGTQPPDGDTGITDGGIPTPDATTSDADTDGPLCPGHGPIVLDAGLCTSDLARIFRFAACACEQLSVSGQLTTSSFDSSDAGGAADAGEGGAPAASIAANGMIAINAITTLGGSVWAGGQTQPGMPAVTLSNDGSIAYDLQSGSSVAVGGTFRVGGDVYATGDIVVQDPDGGKYLAVTGAVHLTDAGSASPGVTAGQGVTYGPVQVPASPCDCDTNRIPVFTIVNAQKDNNDNSLAMIDAASLVDPQAPVKLPCGRYYVGPIQGSTVELDIGGRVGLFAEGPISVDGGFTIALENNDAELDLFVANDVYILNATSIGSVTSPARVRMYVGGMNVVFTGSNNLGANIYAPSANVELASNFAMRGALLAKNINCSGGLSIEYDTSVLGTSGCTPINGSCNTCEDCPGKTPACIAGTCGPCSTTADCCAPLVCQSGACVPLSR
jgi:hypothetical protein